MSRQATASARPTIPLADLHAQHASIDGSLRSAIDGVLAHGRFVGGPEIELFEQEYASYCQADHCIGVSSGTDALTVGLMAAGIGRGDEVIIPSMTFFATAESIVSAGANPVVVDVDLQDGLMTVERAAAAITDRTAAIIPVHLYGQTVDLTAMRALGSERGLLLIEDAAQAHGAFWRGERAGSVGALAAFSFFPGKNLGALGDAGAITTSDERIAVRARRLRDHGRSGKYQHEQFGVNARMDTIQAAMLLVKLTHLDRWNEDRRRHARAYDAAFADAREVTPLRTAQDAEHVFHQYVVRVSDRAQLMAGLDALGVSTGIHYPVPLHRQAPLAGSLEPDDFPGADRLANEVLSLPIYPELSDDQRGRVIEAVLELAVSSA